MSACLVGLLPLVALVPAAAAAGERRAAGPVGVAPASAAPTTVAPPPPPAAWVLVDADSGNVVDAGNDHALLPPASLTKVITALAALAALPPGPVTVPVSARAAAMPASKISMKAGEVWTLTDTLYALMLSSANDAAVALAERAGGTVEGFQRIFAATAAGIGMADHPLLNDPAGLDGPDGVEGGNLVSARDLAIAARALLDQPTLAAIVATPIYYFTGPDGFHHRLTNHNYSLLTSYPGAVGVKTGYTRRAGNCLIAAARRDGRTMIAVVMHSTNPNLAARTLLDKGFATPVAAEPTADHLPPLHPQAAPAASPGKPKAAAAAPAATQVTTADRPQQPTPAGRHHGAPWSLVIAVLLLLVTGTAVALRVGVVARDRRHERAVGRRNRPAERHEVA